MPVSLTVWPFTLPSTASLKSAFGLSYGTLVTAHGACRRRALRAPRPLRAARARPPRDRLQDRRRQPGPLPLRELLRPAARGGLAGDAPRRPHDQRRVPGRRRRLRELGELLPGQGLVRPALPVHLRRAAPHLRLDRHPHARPRRQGGEPRLPHPGHHHHPGRRRARRDLVDRHPGAGGELPRRPRGRLEVRRLAGRRVRRLPGRLAAEGGLDLPELHEPRLRRDREHGLAQRRRPLLHRLAELRHRRLRHPEPRHGVELVPARGDRRALLRDHHGLRPRPLEQPVGLQRKRRRHALLPGHARQDRRDHARAGGVHPAQDDPRGDGGLRVPEAALRSRRRAARAADRR